MDEKIFDMQSESTKRLMLGQSGRKPEDDCFYHAYISGSSISTDAQCIKEDGTVDLNVRNFTKEEKEFYEAEHGKSKIYGHDRQRGAWVEERRPAGQKTANVFPSKETRERGANAFMRALSVDAIKHKFKMMMKDLFKPTHAEIMAESIKKAKDE